MEVEAEPVGKEIAQHRHLLVSRGPDLARSYGKNVVVIGFDPRRAAKNGSRIEIVCGCDEQLEGVILSGKTIGALHGNESAGLGIGSDALYGRHFKRFETGASRWTGAWCRCLCKDSRRGKKQGCPCNLSVHTDAPSKGNRQ